MALAILGWGTALPEVSVAAAESVDFVINLNGLTPEQARMVPVLYRRTAIHKKHSVLARVAADGSKTQDFYAQADDPEARGPSTRERMAVYAAEALPLALRAAREALAASGVAPGEITHIVQVSCTGFVAPGIDIGLIRELGLPLTTERAQVGFMGCHGALNGLKVADGFTALRPGARALLVAVELCTLHYQYGWDPDRVVSNALFADGAAAVVAAPAAEAPAPAWRLAATGSRLFEDSLDAMTWNVGDHGFEMTLSARVPDLIASSLRPWLEGWLGGAGLALEDVATWAIHPGGPRIIQEVERALALPPEAAAVSREVLRECGNMSSPTILFILQRLAAAGAPRPCVALAFGPGLVAEAALFR